MRSVPARCSSTVTSSFVNCLKHTARSPQGARGLCVTDDILGVISGNALSAVSVLFGQRSPLGKEGASGLKDTDRILGQDERRRLIVYGASKISWPPTRRHRIAGSPSSSTNSKVARPSGPANDQVISQMPEAR